MSALDFSHFKKIKQDKKCATLLHPDGHEIKVYVSGLSPSLQKKLSELPLHQAEGSKEAVEPLDEESPVQTNEDNPVVDPAHNPPVQDSAAPQAAEESAATPTPEATTVPIEDAAEQPAPPAEPMTIAAPAYNPDQDAAEKTKENMSFGQDLSNGHIAPKTYGDLFAEKSTLGKVGTLFGLLLSGVGSGLSHQPNAVMKMMDQQIQNDLEAQKTRQANKQNWFKLSMEHTRNQVVNALTGSEAYLKASEADKQQMLIHAMGVADHEASTQALNSMRLASLQDQQNNINKLPPGPQRDAAQQLLNGVVAENEKQMHQDNLKVAEQKQQMMGAPASANGVAKSNPPPKGAAQPGVKYDVVDQGKLNEGFRKGLLFGHDAGKIPGAIPQEKHAAINKEIEELTVNRNNLADADDSFNKLSKLKNAGQVPISGALAGAGTALGAVAGIFGPTAAAAGAGLGHFIGGKAGESVQHYFERNRAIQVEALKSRLGGNMSENDKQKLAESLLPAWSDNPESMAEAHRKMVQHFESNPAEAAPNLTQYGLKQPMPKYQFKSASKKEAK